MDILRPIYSWRMVFAPTARHYLIWVAQQVRPSSLVLPRHDRGAGYLYIYCPGQPWQGDAGLGPSVRKRL